MGMDPEAHLMYGYHLGGPESGWKIQGVDRFEALETSWYAEGDDFYEAIELKLLEMVGFADTYEASPTTYYKTKGAAEKLLKVKIRFTGAESGMDYTLYAPVIPDDADQHLAEAIAYLGITPTQPAPSWVLGALYF